MNVTRNTYFKRLQDLSEIDRRVMFVSADCAGLVFEEYRRTHPESFVNVGPAVWRWRENAQWRMGMHRLQLSGPWTKFGTVPR